METPKIIPYLEAAERAKRELKMTEHQGMNVSNTDVELKSPYWRIALEYLFLTFPFCI